ncbi:prenyltransferase/squalene oxidase repeat-containing protein [Streptomyces specialis]|uniref:prenyltransferase/squalene oxidase repeat-containing protein n=1 Tax=Streptomyces specialis TaxID=498367 RepID=UPI00073ECF75|nr:prenyltransferase/squalene oxidase repeat-containing protein [Streptomyces specialis]
MSHQPTPTFARSRGHRAAAALAGAAVLLTAALPAASAADDADSDATSASDPLFGEADPQYDGVWRQSLALLAQDAAGDAPAGEAVEWLLAQQGEDGSFLASRADVSRPCDDVTAADSNATAVAVQALAALGGHDEAVASALAWLTGVQNEDGGWSYNPGGASDADSTGVVVGAFAAAGEDPADVVRDGSSPFDALAALQLGCGADQEERGAFAWQPEPGGELFPSDLATVDAVLASYGSGLLVDPESVTQAPVVPLDCEGDEDPADPEGSGATEGSGDTEDSQEAEDPENPEATDEAALSPRLASASAGAARLAGLLADGEQHLVTVLPGGEEQPDYATTARAVIALSAGGHEEARQGPLDWLREHHDEWTGRADSPQSLAVLVLAAHAGGASPHDFGGSDLVEELNALGPAPEEAGSADGTGGAGASDDGSGSGALPWVLGAGLALGLLIGVFLSLRGRRAKSDATP